MNLKVKFAIIAFITVLCAWNVWPPDKKLKRGIDLEGGTSLLYQIDTTGYVPSSGSTAAQDMIRILRQRIDPSDKANLIWRPHGADRIEIQMPLATQQSRELRANYQNALEALMQYNIDLRPVRQALIHPAGMSDEDYRRGREETFRSLTQKAPEQFKGLQSLAAAYDAQQTAESQLEKALQAEQQARQTLTDLQVLQRRVDALYLKWAQLDDPNRTAQVALLAGENTPGNAAPIRAFIEARRTLDRLNETLRGPEGLEAKYSQAWQELESANFDPRSLEMVAETTGSKRQTGIQELKTRYPHLAEQGLIDRALEAYEPYAKIKGRLDDPEDLKRKLRGAGVLEYRIIPLPGELTNSEIERYTEGLQEVGPIRSSDDKYAWMQIRSPDDFRRDVVRGVYLGVDYVLASNRPEETMLHVPGGEGWQLRNCRPTSDSLGRPAVGFSFNEAGTSLFWDLTKAHKDRLLGIFLDDEAISAPSIDEPIYQSGIIRGSFTPQEVQDLVDKLNAGSLPARLSDQPISENTIGPTMGHDNLASGLKAGMIGLIAVAGFMLVYYMFAGSLADLALFMNLLLITGIMAFSRATFTMPGIAGLILTIGMAVDANVLVFERIREEQTRGSSLRMAIHNGYSRALSTIIDANVTTFVTALILWLLASEEVKGFALTLMIGIVSSMFTALFVTRAVFDLFTGRRWLKNKIRMLQFIKNAQVDWMRARPVFFIVSALVVVGAWIVFLGRDEQTNSKYSIEFTGGTNIHVVLNEAGKEMTRADVEAAVQQAGREMGYPQIENARVQRIFRDNDPRKEFEIVTTETNRLKVALQKTAGSPLTAAQIQDAVRQAAREAQDPRRMGNAVVTGESEPGQFTLVTNQTNLNTVRDVLQRALLKLAPVQIESVHKRDDGLDVMLTVQGGATLDAEELQRQIRTTAEDQRVGDMDQATVTGGDEPSSYRVQVAQTNADRVRRIIRAALTHMSPVQYGQIATDPIVSRAVLTALEGKLDVLESLAVRDVQSARVTEELVRQRPYLQEYQGGLWLRTQFGETQTETMPRLRERFERSRTRSGFEHFGDNPFALFAPDNKAVANDQPLSAVELAVLPRELIYGGGEVDWDEFAAGITGWFRETLDWTTSLPQVTQIDPSVGSKSRNDALVAIVFSLVAIIIYIWIRFGTVRFGMAAVIALVHDVSIAMGMVAASAWLSETAVGRFLLISDFKIDLPMIAGFLTVIGYSMNDTIVVFDRIRENRGKLATLSSHIINNSINQTLSRTILTSGTTMIVLIIMYIWGGPGLRGFNYVLFIGIFVGTYSSIGIAAPLLYGARAEQPEKKQAAARPVGIGRKEKPTTA
ncbi:MAG: protein translocase subunit SecD [Sedimentisphaerales bacterium]|nr:protein translocase subunit SecD [Sedimentisphaerales bacterium]